MAKSTYSIELQKFSHSSGWGTFKKHCRLTKELGRYKKAYKVPGTMESGVQFGFERMWSAKVGFLKLEGIL